MIASTADSKCDAKEPSWVTAATKSVSFGQLSKPYHLATTNRALARSNVALRISESVSLSRATESALPGKSGWYRLIHRIASESPDLWASRNSSACFSYCSKLERIGSGFMSIQTSRHPCALDLCSP